MCTYLTESSLMLSVWTNSFRHQYQNGTLLLCRASGSSCFALMLYFCAFLALQSSFRSWTRWWNHWRNTAAWRNWCATSAKDCTGSGSRPICYSAGAFTVLSHSFSLTLSSSLSRSLSLHFVSPSITPSFHRYRHQHCHLRATGTLTEAFVLTVWTVWSSWGHLLLQKREP